MKILERFRMSSMINDLKLLFNKAKVDQSHGIDHAIAVMEHADKALLLSDISERKKFMVKTAALLHDADDRKFFPKNTNYKNAMKILSTTNFSEYECSMIIRMIDLVSASKNKNINNFEKSDQWMLIPRWADRLEAIGWIGIIRAWDYGKSIGLPLWTEETLKPKSYRDLRKRVAPRKRYLKYDGKSVSFIDHCYDKLLHLSVETGNKYIDREMKYGIKIIENVCLLFGNLGFVPNYVYSTAVKEIKNKENKSFSYSICRLIRTLLVI